MAGSHQADAAQPIHFIDGEWVERDEWLTVDDPDSGEEVGRVPVARPEDVETAVTAATNAFGSRLPGHERFRVLTEAARLLEERVDEAAELIAREGIKTISEAWAEARRAAEQESREAAQLGPGLTGDALDPGIQAKASSMCFLTRWLAP